MHTTAPAKQKVTLAQEDYPVGKIDGGNVKLYQLFTTIGMLTTASCVQRVASLKAMAAGKISRNRVGRIYKIAKYSVHGYR